MSGYTWVQQKKLDKCIRTIIPTTLLLAPNKATLQKTKGANRNKVFEHHILLNWGEKTSVKNVLNLIEGDHVAAATAIAAAQQKSSQTSSFLRCLCCAG